MRRTLPRGLYAITDSGLIGGERLIPAVAQAISGGAVMIQYRDKGDDHDRRLWEAQDLVSLCRPLGVPLIINDDVELAAQCGADGVHLGRDDGDIAAARARLGSHAILGVSCYNEMERAIAAADAGADYIAFGRFFASASKPQAIQANPELLLEAKKRLSVPVVAIGGITAENGGQLVAAGADMLAVIHAVFGQADITRAARDLADLYRHV